MHARVRVSRVIVADEYTRCARFPSACRAYDMSAMTTENRRSKSRKTETPGHADADAGDVCPPLIDADSGAEEKLPPFRLDAPDRLDVPTHFLADALPCDARASLRVGGDGPAYWKSMEAAVSEEARCPQADECADATCEIGHDDEGDAEDVERKDEEHDSAAADGSVHRVDNEAGPIAGLYSLAAPAVMQQRRLATKLADLKATMRHLLELNGECTVISETGAIGPLMRGVDMEVVRITPFEQRVLLESCQRAGWHVRETSERATKKWTVSIPPEAADWTVEDAEKEAGGGAAVTGDDLYVFVSPKAVQYKRLQRVLVDLKAGVEDAIEAAGFCDVHDEATHYFVHGQRRVPLTPLEHRIIIKSAEESGWHLQRTNTREARRWRIHFPPLPACTAEKAEDTHSH